MLPGTSGRCIFRRRLLADETEQRRGGKRRRGGAGGHRFPGLHPADVDDDGRDNVNATDPADLCFRGIVLRHRRPHESATRAATAAAAGTARIIPDAADGHGRVLVVHPRRARQNSALRERYPVPAGFAEAIDGEPLFVQQDARHIEVADER